MRWLVALLVLLLLVLQYRLWFGENGARQVMDLQTRIAEQEAENRQLAERNDALAAEVEDLKSGLAAIEERARAEIGMIREGETFHQVVDPPDEDDDS